MDQPLKGFLELLTSSEMFDNGRISALSHYIGEIRLENKSQAFTSMSYYTPFPNKLRHLVKCI